MKIYISGPMTGLYEDNRPAFRAAELRLRGAGYEVWNPGNQPVGLQREQYMHADITGLIGCDAVALLDGWEESVGSQLEVRIAGELSLRVMHIEQWILRAVRTSRI